MNLFAVILVSLATATWGYDSCTICLFAMRAAIPEVGRNCSNGHVSAVLSAVCSKLPPHIHSECAAMMNSYKGKLETALERRMTNATMVCQFAGACAQPPAKTGVFYQSIGRNVHHDLRSPYAVQPKSPGRWKEVSNYDHAGLSQWIILGTIKSELIAYSVAPHDNTKARELLAFSLTNNQTKWKFTPPGTSGSIIDPILSNDGSTVYIATTDGYLSAVDVQTGTQKWQTFANDAAYLTVSPNTGNIFVLNNSPWSMVSFFPNGTRQTHLLFSQHCHKTNSLPPLTDPEAVISYDGTSLLFSGSCYDGMYHWTKVVNIDIRATPKEIGFFELKTDSFPTKNLFSMVTPNNVFVYATGVHVFAAKFSTAATAGGGSFTQLWVKACTNSQSYCIWNVEGPPAVCASPTDCDNFWVPNPNYDWLNSNGYSPLMMVDESGSVKGHAGPGKGLLPPESSFVVGNDGTLIFTEQTLNGGNQLYGYKGGLQVTEFPMHTDAQQLILLADYTILETGAGFLRKYKFVSN